MKMEKVCVCVCVCGILQKAFEGEMFICIHIFPSNILYSTLNFLYQKYHYPVETSQEVLQTRLG